MAVGGQFNEDEAFEYYKRKATSQVIETSKQTFDSQSSEEKEKGCEKIKKACDRFFDTDEYKSGEKTYLGYVTCCDMCSQCGGVSGWVIFLIIVLVLGVLAGGAAAFWFFYWKRKYGGKEEEENTESTENSKTVIEISVGTY